MGRVRTPLADSRRVNTELLCQPFAGTFFLYENQFDSVNIFHKIKFLCYNAANKREQRKLVFICRAQAVSHSYECKDNENFSFSAEYLGFSSKIMFFYEFRSDDTLTLARLTAVQNICPIYNYIIRWDSSFMRCHCMRILKNYLVISRKMITFASDI